MYYYFYDSYLSDKKYQPALVKIETRLTDLGINGKINRLSFLKNIRQILTEEINHGVKTVVVVGNDQTVGQIINYAAGLPLTLGFIPLGGSSQIANLLAIPEAERACDVLSVRLVEKLDVGQINDYYFLTGVELGGRHIQLNCDNSYFIDSQSDENRVNISNLNFCYQTLCDPTDGELEIFIESIKKKIWSSGQSQISRFKGRTIQLASQPSLPIFLTDEKKIIKTPALIRLAAQKINFIVGKNRPFNREKSREQEKD